MKLFITRDQAKGTFGGISFELRARVELATEEAVLVKKYKAHKEVLFKKETGLSQITGGLAGFVTPGLAVRSITIEDMVNGQVFKCKDIGEILGYEAMVKESCEAFKIYIEAMRSFGGEEVIEY